MDIKKHLRNPRYVGAKSSKIGCIISKIDWKSNCRHTSIVLLADVQGSFSDRNRGRKGQTKKIFRFSSESLKISGRGAEFYFLILKKKFHENLLFPDAGGTFLLL